MDLQVTMEAMEVEVDIPELSQTEMEARMRAVTLVEVDNPQLPPLDDWATPTEDGLPRITVDMFGAEELLPDVNQELASVLHDEGDLSAMVPPPPVRPRGSASDPHVEVTPTVQEEKKKRSPRQPAEDIANPGDIEDVNPPNIGSSLHLWMVKKVKAKVPMMTLSREKERSKSKRWKCK